MTKTKDKPRKIARASAQPRGRAKDGKVAATALEIEEGAAFMAMSKRKTGSPAQVTAYDNWERLLGELYRTPGEVATTRCATCGVRLFGRTRDDGCGNDQCGSKKGVGH